MLLKWVIILNSSKSQVVKETASSWCYNSDNDFDFHKISLKQFYKLLQQSENRSALQKRLFGYVFIVPWSYFTIITPLCDNQKLSQFVITLTLVCKIVKLPFLIKNLCYCIIKHGFKDNLFTLILITNIISNGINESKLEQVCFQDIWAHVFGVNGG